MKTLLQFTAIAYLCFFITTFTLAQKTKPIAYGNNPSKGKYVDIKGFKMYYEVYGTGKPLLFIHGNGGSISSFSKQIPYFSKEYKVIVADSRAQGKSVDAGEILNYEMMADDCNALLDHLHLDSCYVVGWSDGGINGLLLAMRHPEKVKKLAITGANLWPDTTALVPFVHRWIVNQADSLSKLKQTPEVKNQFKLMNMMLKEPNISLGQLKAVKCPTLVIAGDHDVIPTKHTVQIAEAISQSY
jgi:pimeloyl-ACP methyl ester carboxylesterase